MSETGGQPGVHRSQKPGEIVPEVGTPEDPDDGIQTTDRCVVQHHSEAKEGNSDLN